MKAEAAEPVVNEPAKPATAATTNKAAHKSTKKVKPATPKATATPAATTDKPVK